MKALILALLAVLSMATGSAQARVYYESGGYWHGHPRAWWVRHHYYWSNGAWVLSPGYNGIAPVYGYSPYRYGHRYYYRNGHRRYYRY